MANNKGSNSRPNREMNRQMQALAAQQGQAGMVLNETQIAEAEALAKYFEEDFQPCNDWLLIKIINQKVSKGGVLLPDGVKATTEPDRAEVVRTGPGAKDEDGNLVPMKFSPGDTVYPVFTGMRPALQFKLTPDITYFVAAAECIVGVSVKHNSEDRVKELINA